MSSEATGAWKDQLELSKACTSTGPEGRCWLITKLPAWNRILCGLAYELVEPVPGNLSLQCLPYGAVDRGPIAAVRQSASLVSLLLQQHHCINDLHVMCTTDSNDTTPKRAPVPIHLRPASGRDAIRHIQHLEVKTCRAEVLNTLGSSYIPEEDIVGVCDLEDLKINSTGGEFEAGLTKLLRRNSFSLKAVEIAGMNLSQRLVDSLQCLKRCESLVLSYCRNQEDSRSSTDVLTMLVQSLGALKNFSFFPFIDSEWSVSAILDALQSSVTLTKLELCMYQSTSWARELFAALGVNTSIKNLRIGFRGANATCGDLLASALRKNTSLLELDLRADVDDGFMICVADSLSQNAALDRLVFTNATVYARGVLALCHALRTNKTLQQLMFPTFQASITERVLLANILAHGDGYRRVRLPFTAPDMSRLSTRLACPASSPEVLIHVDIDRVPNVQFKLLCDALSSSSRVHTCSFHIEEDPAEKTAMLSEMLRVNRSIRSLEIVMKRERGKFIRKVLRSLRANEGVCDMTITSVSMGMETAVALSNFFARNRTLTKFQLSFLGGNFSQFVDLLYHGMSTNPVIVDVEIAAAYTYGRTHQLINETVRRNRHALNRAVDFVVLHSMDKAYAEAFELFNGRPCFLSLLTKTLGRPECEALVAVASAENFLRDNYLVITGIVKSVLVCHPADDGCTQLDELNAQCWHVIVSHLKVSDVLP